MKIHMISLALAIAAGGCAHEAGLPDFYPAETEAKFGAAVRQNIAAQTVNPDAPDSDELTAGGARAALAYERYLEDEVEKPSSTSTLKVTEQSGGSGASE